jgi:phosphatidylserine decarboxylase
MIAWGGRNWTLGTLLFVTLSLLGFLIISSVILIYLAVILLVLELFFLNFFRDPERTIGSDIVAPADGRIMSIETVKMNSGTKSYYRVATFMNVYNVHVNRTPIAGRVIKMRYKPGQFKPAYNKDSINNEQLETTLKTSIGRIVLIQIAGILAKRIVPYICTGDVLKKGQRLGIIQFGSRVDVILPKDRVKIMVSTGDKVKAGSSCLASIIN